MRSTGRPDHGRVLDASSPWLVGLLCAVMIFLPGCDGVSRAISELIFWASLALGGGLGVVALIIAGLSVRTLRRRTRSKALFFGAAVFGLPLVALTAWWAVWGLIEDMPHQPMLLTPVAIAILWALVIPLATAASFEPHAPVVISGALAVVFVLLELVAVVALWPRRQIPSGAVVQMALGPGTLCVRFEGGEVLCDGRFRGHHGSHSRPVRAPAAIDVAVAEERACLATTEGELWCWDSVEMPARVASDVQDVELAGSSLMTRGRDGTWRGAPAGLLEQGQTPVTGGGTVCALREGPEGPAVCAVGEQRGEVRVYDASQIAMHGQHLCASEGQGRVRCVEPLWDRYPRSEPVAEITDARQIAVGRKHGCARTGDGRVRCWGDYTGSTGAGAPPGGHAHDVGLQGVTDLAATDGYTCAIRDGEVWCWGAVHLLLDSEPSFRQVGSLFGSTSTSYHPTPGRPRWE